MRNLIVLLVDVGSLNVVDEAIYAYTGKDARKDGVDVKMEGKPHPYGLFNYLAAERLKQWGFHCDEF